MPTATTANLTGLAGALGVAVGGLSRALIRESADVSRTTLSVLATLRDGPRRVTELALSEHVAQPTMTVLLSRLERRGWVERGQDERDRRAVSVAITPAGLEMLAEVQRTRAELLAARLEQLAPDELSTLERAVPVLARLLELGGTR